MAADAAQERTFLLIIAWKTCEPLGICQLRGEIFRLAQLEVELGGLLATDAH